MEKKSVLIVDDDKGVGDLLAETLGDDDRYELLQAEDGISALEKVRAHHPSIIFLDVIMPRKNGFEVCRELKQDPDTWVIKIIILTAVGQDEARRAGFEAGADDYFTKPFSPVALIGKAEEMLGLR